MAELNGYDSFLMLNIYPLRSTNPALLPKSPDLDLMKSNLEHIAKALATNDSPIWAAWGAFIEKRDYLIPALLNS